MSSTLFKKLQQHVSRPSALSGLVIKAIRSIKMNTAPHWEKEIRI